MADGLLSKKYLQRSVPAPQCSEERRLIDAAVRFFKQDVSQVRRTQLKPNAESK